MMIKGLLSFILIILFFSCDLGYHLQDHYEADIAGFMVENGIDTQGRIQRWVADTIDYKIDNPEEFWKVDDWQTPEETFCKRTGDCDDVTILLMFMLDKININSYFIIIKDHFIIKINNIYYEPQNTLRLKVDSLEIIKVMTLNEVLHEAEYSLFRNIK